ncbi:MAG: glutathione S-transferase N-terminal domain-containing protein [Pseudomonadota bacterium]|nr:stringent starvation protein A [Gammaproteobacteria bacterium]MEC8421946.1 glutathione S-transferase N-terminal domain-containing protein [Pseudomonadota bacterium]|tara:strand:+ start:57 stop:659 length:603 start_codon:yes stop_codon:yes gene_type:complete
MTLYSNPECPQSHRVRIVLGEKDLTFKVQDIQNNERNEDLISLNPNHSTPTFVDRNLVLYESRVIMEYLDERFPHPPLMPVDPVVRAKTRMVLHYIERDLYGLLNDIGSSGEKKSSQAKAQFKNNLMSAMDFFQSKKYFLGEDFSLIDCSMAPLLWRLPFYNITLPKNAKPLISYSEKIFDRKSFQENLSDFEQEINTFI